VYLAQLTSQVCLIYLEMTTVFSFFSTGNISCTSPPDRSSLQAGDVDRWGEAIEFVAASFPSLVGDVEGLRGTATDFSV